MTVLVVSTSTDDGIESVGRALERRGARWVRLDTDHFPTSVRLRHHPDESPPRAELLTTDGGVDASAIRAVWYRRCHPARHVASRDDAIRRACVDASRIALEGVLSTVDAFHLDPHDRIRTADNKPAQLAVARKAGLDVPRTVVTNDPDEARAFASSCSEGVVTKMPLPSTFLPDAPGAFDAGRTMYTTALSPEDLANLDGLDQCPMIFQERLRKALELRVTVVGKRVFTAALDPGNADVDWRRDQDAVLDTYRPHELPAALCDRLIAMLERFGLRYGAFDLVLTPEGRYVLLELNPAGEFHFVEQRLGFPIAEAIAGILIDPPSRA